MFRYCSPLFVCVGQTLLYDGDKCGKKKERNKLFDWYFTVYTNSCTQRRRNDCVINEVGLDLQVSAFLLPTLTHTR